MKLKEIPRDKLIIRPSRQLFFGGGELWCEELDALSVHTDIVCDKFREDLRQIQRPSTPSRIVVNLSETLITEEVARTICGGLISSGNTVTKAAFTGLDRASKKLFIKELSGAQFVYTFLSDYEKAKEWAVSSD